MEKKQKLSGVEACRALPRKPKTHTRTPAPRLEKKSSSNLVLLAALVDQRLVDVRDDAATCDCRLDQRVEFLVSADGELQVARRDALDFQVLGGVAGELEDLGGEVLFFFFLSLLERWERKSERPGSSFFFFRKEKKLVGREKKKEGTRMPPFFSSFFGVFLFLSFDAFPPSSAFSSIPANAIST